MKPPSAHPIGARGHGYPGMNMTDATGQQHILAGPEAKGVDVSIAETLLQKSDTTAVSTWLPTYFESHKGERMDATTRFNMSAGTLFPTEKGFNISWKTGRDQPDTP